MYMTKIKKKDPVFQDVKFLAKALNPKEHILYRKIICVKEGTGYATDGGRAHKIEWTGLKDGLYTVEKNTKQEIQLAEADEEISYPDASKMFKTTTGKLLETHQSGNISEDVSVIMQKAGKRIGVNATINYDFLKDALSFGGVFDVYVEKDCRFVFINEKREVAIAPVKYYDE